MHLRLFYKYRDFSSKLGTANIDLYTGYLQIRSIYTYKVDNLVSGTLEKIYEGILNFMKISLVLRSSIYGNFFRTGFRQALCAH